MSSILAFIIQMYTFLYTLLYTFIFPPRIYADDSKTPDGTIFAHSTDNNMYDWVVVFSNGSWHNIYDGWRRSWCNSSYYRVAYYEKVPNIIYQSLVVRAVYFRGEWHKVNCEQADVYRESHLVSL